MYIFRTFAIATLILLLSATTVLTPLEACPFCSAPSLTLSEQVTQSDAIVLVKWASARPAKDDDSGSTSYKVESVLKSKGKTPKMGEELVLIRHRPAKVGDLFVLFGTASKGGEVEWSSPLEVTRASFDYLAKAPATTVPVAKRLEYFIQFLEFPEQMVADDAYGEFANAPYKDITLISKSLSRERIRKWIENPKTSPTRLGLYGLLMGLCGNADDAEMMRAKISQPTEDFRLGIDGLMSGYLLLTGEKGLKVLDTTKLAPPKKIPFSETYAAMQAVRFMWTYAEGRIPAERLCQSMRLLLESPDLADLVIADLARWKDWGIQDRLMEMYEAKEFNIPSIKRAIVRFLIVCSKDLPADANAKSPRHAVKARAHLAALRTKDPNTVMEAERFLFLN